jgi:hypothetical protein
MLDIELFAEGRIRERERYFESPQYKARATWRRYLSTLTDRRPQTQRAQRRVEQQEPITVY